MDSKRKFRDVLVNNVLLKSSFDAKYIFCDIFFEYVLIGHMKEMFWERNRINVFMTFFVREKQFLHTGMAIKVYN